MRFFLISLVILSTVTSYANEIYKFSVDKDLHVEGTYSAEINKGASFHLVLMKVKFEDRYKMLPVYITKTGEVREFDLIALDVLPNIISHHSVNDNISLVSYNDKEKSLSVFEFDIKSKSFKKNKQEEVEKPDTVFRLDNATVLLTVDKKGEKLGYWRIVSWDNQKLEHIDIPEELNKEFKKINAVAINQNEFVEKGSFPGTKAYLNNNELVYIIDDEKSNTSKSIIIDLNNPSDFLQKEFKTVGTNLEKVKDYNSYLYNNKVFTVASNKEDMEVTIHNLKEGRQEKRLSLRQDIFKDNQEMEKFREYLDYTAKGKIKAMLTINETSEGNMAVRIDQADNTSYNYNYNWWWHHEWMLQQNMMMQMQMQQNMRQMMQNLPSGFGPNPSTYEYGYNPNKKSNEPKPIVFVLNNNLDLINNASGETVYPEIEREKYLKEYEDDRNMRNVSASFTQLEIRCVYQDRKSKEIIIDTKLLN